MSIEEEAAITYDPDSDPDLGTNAAVDDAQKELLDLKGVKGTGRTVTPNGHEAIIVYVKNKKARARVPDNIRGYPIIVEIVGEIRTQDVLTPPDTDP